MSSMNVPLIFLPDPLSEHDTVEWVQGWLDWWASTLYKEVR